MLKLLLSVLIELFIGVSLAGVVLALVIPALNLVDSSGGRGPSAAIVVAGVLIAAVAIALFRPGSAIRRYVKH
jgi:hypothetical protein